ncbi:nuclear transport factor 2 family protein [Microbacterium sp. 4R-513]|uniref:nuclear transport factor 2 family protein n=1 Tax=Microbacterium sp. 4R-513 TaxID=2567934 RepID=UPI0013E17C59|nr:nuclear transport factor 2 family protein [Microbacterium sp. 4R-513]QIG38106.1 nuclear transport factor 2 family protein [Microbacterium sp. 4R-513]
MATTEEVVRRYFAIVADLTSTAEDLREVIALDAVFTELPNPISPEGHVRSVDETVDGFRAGKSRLSAQSIEIHEVLVDGERAAVRSTWRGRVGDTEIVAHMGGFLTVRGGRIAAHETYDCYEPFAL